MVDIKIEVRLFATLREGRGKVLNLEVEENSSMSEILDKLEIRKDHVAISLVNGRDKSLDIQLQDGDILSLFPPVGGG